MRPPRKSTTPRTKLPLLATLAGAILLANPVAAIVTANSASADPATDPHIVTGPVTVSDLVTFGHGNLPPIDPDAVVEINILRMPDDPDGNCSASVVETSQGLAVLTAAHCVVFSSLKQVSVELKFHSSTLLYETCHTIEDPGCDLAEFVFVHPNYSNSVARGYDLALVFFEEVISPTFHESYSIASLDVQLNDWNSFVKFGYGCFGYGEDGVDVTLGSSFDHQLRWAMNAWDSVSLGAVGVTACGGTFSNFETQLVHDFDNYSYLEHNLYNFYMNTFDPATGWIAIYKTCDGVCGMTGAEGWGCPGDSGGPNFIYDSSTQEWVIGAVTSYVLRMPDDWNGFVGNSDVDAASAVDCSGRNMSSGEFGGDALVTPQMIDEMLTNPRALPSSGGEGIALPHGGLGLAPRLSPKPQRD